MLFTAFCLMSGLAAASRASGAMRLESRQASQTTADLVFNGGPASYSMSIPADGEVYPTNNNLSINIISDNDYDAYSMCKFYTAGEVTLAQSIDTSTGAQSVIVGPPQPIKSVSCSGACVPSYGRCYDNNNQWLGPCCNGYCAATLCRPWNGV